MTELRSLTEHRLPGADGATIAVAEWPGDGEPIVCVHGLTSSSRAFAGLASELPEHRLLAVDCRGRGRSTKDGPFGMSQHAADLAAVLDAAGIERARFVGHSMGAYVLGAFGAAYPARVSRMVFVDGGYFLHLPGGVMPDDLRETMLGPFLAKLRRAWSSLDEYIAFYESTALYPNGVDAYGRAHFAYDLVEGPTGLRPRIIEDCIGPDWLDVLDHAAVSKRLERISMPLLVLRAPGGLTGAGDELIPDAVCDAIQAVVPHAKFSTVDETNHHTILFSVPGARATATRIRAFLG